MCKPVNGCLICTRTENPVATVDGPLPGNNMNDMNVNMSCTEESIVQLAFPALASQFSQEQRIPVLARTSGHRAVESSDVVHCRETLTRAGLQSHGSRAGAVILSKNVILKSRATLSRT